MINIYIGFPLTPGERDRLLGRCPGARLIESQDVAGTALRQQFTTCEICFGRCPQDWLITSSNLRWLQLDSVGFDDLAQLDWVKLGRTITVTNLAGFFAEPVAESALAGLLALLRGVNQLATLQPQRHWRKMELRPTLRNLVGTRVVLLGYGSIGRRFEALLAPFGCQVTRVSASEGMSETEIDRVLALADVIMCSMPETPKTRHFLNSSRLTVFKHDAILINVGRGGVVDESALEAALRSGRLGGAVLDVTTVEPLPQDSGLWTCPKLILTQHTGGGTWDEGLRKVDAFADNFARFQSGQPLHGVVDFAKGY